jgi:hypothetical protein
MPALHHLALLTAALGCITSCAEVADPVEVALRLMGADGRGDRTAACLPRDPVRFERPTASGRKLDVWASREADLRVGVPVGAAIEALHLPALGAGPDGVMVPEVWLAAWIAADISEPMRKKLAALEWCDVIVDVAGQPHGSAELRPETSRLPVGTFLSFEEVTAAYPQANVFAVEIGAEGETQLATFWAQRSEALWRAVACDEALRSRLEREEPAGLALALEKLRQHGPVDCSSIEAVPSDRVR